MAETILIDGQPGSAVPADDRGFLYGDGVFETVAVSAGRATLWPYHWSRLRAACERLGLESSAESRWLSEIERVAPAGDVVVRLVLTRGSGAGYAPPETARARRVVMRVGPAPAPERRPLRVGFCRTRLGANPAIAGLKHLARLEQVLAAREATAGGWDEGLMRDADDRVVEAIQGNVLARRDGVWITPPLDQCGVAGVYRQYLLERGALAVAPLEAAEIETLDALAICNAVRGVRLVGEVVGVVQYRQDRAPAWLAELDRGVDR